MWSSIPLQHNLVLKCPYPFGSRKQTCWFKVILTFFWIKTLSRLSEELVHVLLPPLPLLWGVISVQGDPRVKWGLIHNCPLPTLAFTGLNFTFFHPHSQVLGITLEVQAFTMTVGLLWVSSPSLSNLSPTMNLRTHFCLLFSFFFWA